MPVDTTTTDRVLIAMSHFRNENDSFWNTATRYASSDPMCVMAEKRLKASANKLMQSLLELVLET